MEKDSKFTRDEDGYIAIRTVSAPYSSGTDDKDSMFTRDEDGYVAVRTIGGAGGGGGDQHNLGYYATKSDLETAHPTAEAGDWAIVGSTDTVWIWDTDNEEWVDSDQKGQVTSVNGQTGDVVLDLLPSQTGNAGKVLTTDGTDASWSNELSNEFNIVAPVSVSHWFGIKATNAPANCYFKLTGSSVGNKYSQTALYVGYPTSSDPYGGQSYFSFLYNYTTSNARTARFFAYGNGVDKTELGGPSDKWTTVYATKLNNGADITVPNIAGTIVVADYTGATAGQALRLDSNGNAVWENITTTPATAPTLVAANWSSNTQTITVQGVTAANTVIVSPIPTDAEDYAAAGILCTGQATNALTFTCQTVPASDLQVNIVIL